MDYKTREKSRIEESVDISPRYGLQPVSCSSLSADDSKEYTGICRKDDHSKSQT